MYGCKRWGFSKESFDLLGKKLFRLALFDSLVFITIIIIIYTSIYIYIYIKIALLAGPLLGC